jgi:hypothetical protein
LSVSKKSALLLRRKRVAVTHFDEPIGDILALLSVFMIGSDMSVLIVV